MSSVSGITLQQFEIFLSAAKHENLTQAAEELHMTPASVSRNIAALEMNLGLVLFIRHKRRVRLTDAGRQLAKDLKVLSRQLSSALEKAYETQKCNYSTLRIGDFNTTPSDAYLLPILDKFEADYPDVEVLIDRTDPLSVVSGLIEKKYDAVFFTSAGKELFEHAGMSYVKILSLVPCIVISKRHRLFAENEIAVRDFCKDTIVTMATSGYSVYWDYARSIFEKYGFSVSNVKFVDNPHSIAMELRRGNCIALMDEFYMPMDRSDLRHIEIPGCEPGLGFGLASDPDNTNPYVHKFINCAKSVFAES